MVTKGYSAQFTVPGKPVGKKRVRFGRGKAYATAETKADESYVAHLALAAGIRKAHSGPVRIEILSVHKRTKKRAKGHHPATCKPDWDNIGKHIGDSLNGIAYDDDSQVIDGRVIKRYTEGDEEPHVVVTLWFL